MNDRSISVHLRANVSDFTREMNKASASLEDLVKKSDKNAKVADTAMGRMVQSARHQRAEWTSVGTTLTGIGAAWTAVNVTVAKTGIAYNTLQQTSRAAMTTMLGGAEAANAQMDKLDAFARTSPFSKAVFLDAQRQMIGFGIETEKVVPYLSAINEAVAATGGSNEDIAELSRIFSQVQANAKLTARDLMQFGQRGVDAATLIGSQMGVTGAEIRAQITAGTLDAGQALDALAAGMEARFGGASENVKNTMEGAADRVKAAFRDLSASFMESAVDPQGGGWLVGLTNSLADVIRKVDELPGPAKTAIGALSGLGGTATLAAGGFLLLAPRMLDTWDAAVRLGMDGKKAAATLGNIGKAAGIAAATFVGLQLMGAALRSLLDHKRDADGLATAVGRLADESTRLSAIDNTLPIVELFGNSVYATNLNELTESFLRLNDDGFWGRINRQADAFNKILGLGAIEAEATAEAYAIMDSALAQLDQTAAGISFSRLAEVHRDEGAAVDDLLAMYPQYANSVRAAAEAQLDTVLSGEQVVALMEGQTVSIRKSTGEWVSYSHATEGYMGAMDGLTESTIEAEVQFRRLLPGVKMTSDVIENSAAGMEAYSAALAEGASDAEALDAALEAMNSTLLVTSDGVYALTEAQLAMVESLSSGHSSFIDMLGAFDAVIEKNREVAQSAADSAESAEASWEDFYDGTTVSAQDYIQMLRDQVAAQEEWASNMLGLAGRVPDAMLAELADMGPEGAALVALFNTMTDAELAETVELWSQRGAEAGDEFGLGILDAAPVLAAAGRFLGQEARDAIQQELENGKPIEDVIADWQLEAYIEANTEPAATTTQEWLDQQADLEAKLSVAADTSPAEADVDALSNDIDSTTGTVDVDADTSQAHSEVDAWEADTNRTSAETTVDANTAPATASTYEWKNTTDRMRATTTVDANTDPAITAAHNAMNRIRAMRTSISVDIRQNITRNVMGQAELASGGRVGDAFGLADGGTPWLEHPVWVNRSGRVNGPGTPTSDSVNARISRDEFVMREKASRYYGYDALYAMNSMMLPREVFAAYGLADGGSPRHTYTPTPSVPQVTVQAPAQQSSGASLSENDIQRIAAAVREGTYAGTHAGIADRRAGSRIDAYRKVT